MEKVWLKNYQPGVPETINPDAYRSIMDLFDDSCQRFKDKPALQSFGTQMTYGQLAEQVRGFAAYCQQVLQLKKGNWMLRKFISNQ